MSFVDFPAVATPKDISNSYAKCQERLAVVERRIRQIDKALWKKTCWSVAAKNQVAQQSSLLEGTTVQTTDFIPYDQDCGLCNGQFDASKAGHKHSISDSVRTTAKAVNSTYIHAKQHSYATVTPLSLESNLPKAIPELSPTANSGDGIHSVDSGTGISCEVESEATRSCVCSGLGMISNASFSAASSPQVPHKFIKAPDPESSIQNDELSGLMYHSLKIAENVLQSCQETQSYRALSPIKIHVNETLTVASPVRQTSHLRAIEQTFQDNYEMEQLILEQNCNQIGDQYARMVWLNRWNSIWKKHQKAIVFHQRLLFKLLRKALQDWYLYSRKQRALLRLQDYYVCVNDRFTQCTVFCIWRRRYALCSTARVFSQRRITSIVLVTWRTQLYRQQSLKQCEQVLLADSNRSLRLEYLFRWRDQLRQAQIDSLKEQLASKHFRKNMLKYALTTWRQSIKIGRLSRAYQKWQHAERRLYLQHLLLAARYQGWKALTRLTTTHCIMTTWRCTLARRRTVQKFVDDRQRQMLLKVIIAWKNVVEDRFSQMSSTPSPSPCPGLKVSPVVPASRIPIPSRLR